MGVNLLAVSERRKDLLAIELQRSCGFMGTVNVVFARLTSTRAVAGKRLKGREEVH